MFANLKRTIAVFPLVLASGAGAALAASSPLGIWIDHTGRGAVEITDCNGALCGRVVWLQDSKDRDGCNLQIIGDVKPVAGGKWDGGWIYDPERQAKYDVEITPVGERKLRVHGYAGMKMFGETMTWARAPDDLKMCGKPDAVQAEVARPVEPQAPLPAPQQHAKQTAGAPTPQQDTNSRSVTPPAREGIGAQPWFTERETASKQKTCTLNVGDLGRFSFPC